MISSRDKAPVHAGARLLVDGTDTSLHRAAEASFPPHKTFQKKLLHALSFSCGMYNMGLSQKLESYSATGKNTSLFDQFGQLTPLRVLKPELFAYGVQPLRSALRRADEAYSAYVQRCAAIKNITSSVSSTPQKAGKPRRKPVQHYDTLCYDETANWKLDLTKGTLTLQGIGTVALSRSAVKQFRRLTDRGGVPASLRITRSKRGSQKDSWNWRLSVVFKKVSLVKTLPTEGPESIVGIDRGVVVTAATSDGVLLSMPSWMSQRQDELADLQRQQATKKLHSRSWQELAAKIRRLKKKVTHLTENWARHEAKKLVAQYGVLALEDLRLVQMTKSAAGTKESPGKNVSQKRGLNRSLQEAALGKLAHYVHVKAEEAGRRTWLVNPRNTSRECSKCSHVSEKNRPTRDVFLCEKCGHTEHADVQASVVIKGRGEKAEVAWRVMGSPLLTRKKPRLQRRPEAVSAALATSP